jgi:hypothetical protein
MGVTIISATDGTKFSLYSIMFLFYFWSSLQCFGFGSDPDSVRSVDPDTDPGGQK